MCKNLLKWLKIELNMCSYQTGSYHKGRHIHCPTGELNIILASPKRELNLAYDLQITIHRKTKLN